VTSGRGFGSRGFRIPAREYLLYLYKIISLRFKIFDVPVLKCKKEFLKKFLKREIFWMFRISPLEKSKCELLCLDAYSEIFVILIDENCINILHKI